MMRKLRASALSADDLAQELPHHAGRFAVDGAGMRHVDGVVVKVRQFEFALQQSAIGVRIGAHAPLPVGRKRLQFGAQPAASSNSFFRL